MDDISRALVITDNIVKDVPDICQIQRFRLEQAAPCLCVTLDRGKWLIQFVGNGAMGTGDLGKITASRQQSNVIAQTITPVV